MFINPFQLFRKIYALHIFPLQFLFWIFQYINSSPGDFCLIETGSIGVGKLKVNDPRMNSEGIPAWVPEGSDLDMRLRLFSFFLAAPELC